MAQLGLVRSMSTGEVTFLLIFSIVLYVLGTIITLYLAGRRYARWAQIAHLLATLALVTWGVLTFFVLHPHQRLATFIR